jgi:hypothetical protein
MELFEEPPQKSPLEFFNFGTSNFVMFAIFKAISYKLRFRKKGSYIVNKDDSIRMCNLNKHTVRAAFNGPLMTPLPPPTPGQ